ncbi:GIY-YIG nuclease family protein, partial [Klebsiella pneumoniae]|nr:GIY-YIG nuclease family protein [Klebsiella pneumoniae]
MRTITNIQRSYVQFYMEKNKHFFYVVECSDGS